MKGDGPEPRSVLPAPKQGSATKLANGESGAPMGESRDLSSVLGHDEALPRLDLHYVAGEVPRRTLGPQMMPVFCSHFASPTTKWSSSKRRVSTASQSARHAIGGYA